VSEFLSEEEYSHLCRRLPVGGAFNPSRRVRVQLQHLRSVRRRKSTGQNGENGWTCAARCHFHDDRATAGHACQYLWHDGQGTHRVVADYTSDHAVEPTDIDNLIAYILSCETGSKPYPRRWAELDSGQSNPQRPFRFLPEEPSSVMNHRHRKVLHALFAHPVSTNIHFKDVMKSITSRAIGSTATPPRSAMLSTALPKEEVAQIRKFLEICGVDPAQFPV
jgi:hypothetical protein